MKTILHWAAADLRRMRGWVAVWLAALAAPVLWAAWAAHADDPQALETVRRSLPLVVVLQWILAHVWMLVLLQADPATGLRQFWRTRPVGPGQLLAAKTLAALTALWGGAVTVGLPWWIWSGAGVAEVATMTGVCLATFVLVALPAMLVCALTDSLGRAVLWSFAAYALLVGAMLPLSLLWSEFGAGAWMADVPARRLAATGGGWLAIAAAVTWARYASRGRSWLAGAVAAALAWPILAMLAVPAGRSAEWPWREEAAALGRGVEVALQEGWSDPLPGRPRPDEPLVREQLRVAFEATPPEEPGLQLVALGARHRWRWPELTLERDDRMLSTRRYTLSGYSAPAPDAETAAFRAAADARVKAERIRAGRPPAPTRRSPGVVPMQGYLIVPASWTARLATVPSHYEAELWMALVRPTPVNRVPFRAGASAAGGGFRATIGEVKTGAERNAVSYTQFAVKSPLHAAAQEFSPGRAVGGPGAVQVAALDPERKEQRGLSQSRQLFGTVHGVEITRWIATFTNGQVRRDGKWVEPEGWLERGELTYVRMEPVAVLARTVTTEGFTLVRRGSGP